MRNRNLQKEKLDRIGSDLLRAARITNEEIEQIVAAPELFDAVKLRIKTEGRRPENHPGSRTNPIFWNRQRISAAFAALALFVCGAVSFVFIGQSWQTDEQAAVVPPIRFEAETIAPISEDFPETAENEKTEMRPQLIAEKKTLHKETAGKPKRERKTRFVKKPARSEIKSPKEFYALNYLGEPNETEEIWRIVRADLSPSALFAFGVNVPIENTKEKIKTDLLVGSDGVARAIRFVE